MLSDPNPNPYSNPNPYPNPNPNPNLKVNLDPNQVLSDQIRRKYQLSPSTKHATQDA